MDKFTVAIRHALAQTRLHTSHASSSSSSDRHSGGGDNECLLAPPLGDSESTVMGREGGKYSQEEAGITCDCVCHDKHVRRRRSRRHTWLQRLTPGHINLFASLFWVVGTVGILLLFGEHRRSSTPAHGSFGWSPIIDAGAVEYVEYTFPYFDLDEGQEKWNNRPSREQDVRWFESYNWLARIPNSDAAKIPNGTITIPGDEEHSVVWLGVFHELHCLNILRKLVWFEYYDVHADLVAGRNNMRNHLVHCIDALRKGTMCHADITPIPFWSQPELKNGEITPMFKIPHTCRNYDRIRDWAKAHPVERFACEGGEDACGSLNAITMTVPPGEPQPTHWEGVSKDAKSVDGEEEMDGVENYSDEKKKMLNCDQSVLDWC